MILRGLRKYFLPVAAIVATISFWAFHSNVFSTNYHKAVSEFQASFLEEEAQLKKVLDYKAKQLDGREIDEQWKELSDYNGINIHVYRNDSLIFWNTNQLPIIRFAEIHFPAQGLLSLQNGWYYAKTQEAGDFLICASFLIKHDYAYENRHLVNTFSKNLPFRYAAQIIPDKDLGYPIYDDENKYVCSIEIDKKQEVSRLDSILLYGLLIASISLWLAFVFRLSRRVPASISWAFPLLVLLIRYAALKYKGFQFMSETDFTDPSIYGANDWLPNFLEYTLHITVLIYLMFDLRWRLKSWKQGTVSKIFAYVLPFFVLLPWALLLYFIKILIENSTIPLSVNQLFSLNVFSIFSIASFGVYFFAYLQFSRGVIDLAKRNGILGSRMTVLYFAVCCLFLLFEINYGYSLLYAGIFPMVFLGALLYLAFKTRIQRELGSGLFMLCAFSMVLSLTIDDLEQRKERSVKELYANQLATEKDIVTEAEYESLSPKLAKDKFLQKFILSQNFISSSAFQENLERRFFNGFWERYEMEFALFNGNHLPIVDRIENTTEAYDDLQEIIDSSGVVSELDSNIYFISDYRNQYNYIIRQEMRSGDSTAIFFCTLKSTKIPEEIGFPRLLISGSTDVFESIEDYSIAKYYGNRLLNKYGEFNYPSSASKLSDGTVPGNIFVNFDGYNHFILRKSPDYTVVLSSKNPDRIEVLTSFSYIFSFFGLLLLPMLFRINRSGNTRATLGLAMKIQLVLMSLVFLSLLAFGYGSGVFVSNQHHEYTHDIILEKLNSVDTEVGAKLGSFSSLSMNESGDRMQFYLEKFSRVFFTDINLYDLNGYLLATSRPRVFNSGLISEQMNSEAFFNLKYEEKSEYLGHERIGSLNYSSAYKPFYNRNGKMLGYLNLQHFGQQGEFETQIQEFLVAIINVFILLLAVSILLAIFISNWLTTPLRILQESFSAVRFGTPNERIEYDKDDEIGALVKDYNLKLDELEFAAQQLARSERESAWREMAKQVAHEIKNPLTPMKLSVQQLLRSYNANDPGSEEKLRKVANSIIEQIDALTKIANEFSNFAKMPLPSEEKLDAIALIQSVKQVFELSGRSEIKIQTKLEEGIIRADKDQMIRVFNNLIKNAIQAVPESRESKIEITIDKVGERLAIRVKDNGGGIDESQQSKIFVPYFTTKSTGTGLGLAMVRQIIENHHGTIDFDSVVGVGTTFIIDLPLSK